MRTLRNLFPKAARATPKAARATPKAARATPKAARAILGAALAVATLAGLAAPAGAQQLVDAGKEGDGSGALAFVLMALLVMLIWAALFFMDRVRRRREQTTPAE